MLPVFKREDGWYYVDRNNEEVGPFPTQQSAMMAYNKHQGCTTGSCED